MYISLISHSLLLLPFSLVMHIVFITHSHITLQKSLHSYYGDETRTQSLTLETGMRPVVQECKNTWVFFLRCKVTGFIVCCIV